MQVSYNTRFAWLVLKLGKEEMHTFEIVVPSIINFLLWFVRSLWCSCSLWRALHRCFQLSNALPIRVWGVLFHSSWEAFQSLSKVVAFRVHKRYFKNPRKSKELMSGDFIGISEFFYCGPPIFFNLFRVGQSFLRSVWRSRVMVNEHLEGLHMTRLRRQIQFSDGSRQIQVASEARTSLGSQAPTPISDLSQEETTLFTIRNVGQPGAVSIPSSNRNNCWNPTR